MQPCVSQGNDFYLLWPLVATPTQTCGHSGAQLGCRGGWGHCFPCARSAVGWQPFWAGPEAPGGWGVQQCMSYSREFALLPPSNFSYLETGIIFSSLSQMVNLPLSDSLNKDLIFFKRDDFSLCNHWDQ